MEIVWSRQSLEDFESIASFIAQDNPARAVSFIEELIASVERLAEFPESGPRMPEQPVFRQLVYSGYRVAYLVEGKVVKIVAVLSPGRKGVEA